VRRRRDALDRDLAVAIYDVTDLCSEAFRVCTRVQAAIEDVEVVGRSELVDRRMLSSVRTMHDHRALPGNEEVVGGDA
jgi:hypothetical protein